MKESTAPEIKEEGTAMPVTGGEVPAEDPMEAMLKQMEQDMDLLRQENHQLRCARDQARDYAKGIARQLKRERAERTQSIKWPCILAAAFFILCLLVVLCSCRGWMVNLLAEILSCLFLCACTFFGGIVWSCTAVKRNSNQK